MRDHLLVLGPDHGSHRPWKKKYIYTRKYIGYLGLQGMQIRCLMTSFILALVVLNQVCLGVKLDIKKLIESFDRESIINPPNTAEISTVSVLLPKVLLWSPQEQLKCPVHGNSLQPSSWTVDVSGEKNDGARLVFDLNSNVILVQMIYTCKHFKLRHNLRATTPDLHDTLPDAVKQLFPVIIFQRSACTKQLIQYIQTQVMQGVNFLKISEGLASLNFQEFYQRIRVFSHLNFVADNHNFYNNEMFSFPNNDQVMNIFLDSFNKHKELYEAERKSLSAKSISCDHTFKVSRNIGLVRESDDAFVPQFKQLFILLNEFGQVLCWRLTTTQTFAEIEDMLVELKDRQEEKGEEITAVYVDNCCLMKNKYNSIFKGVDVKLYLFHAIQRINTSSSF